MSDATVDVATRRWFEETTRRIPIEENAGSSNYFEKLLAPVFAMKRRSGFVDRVAFLSALTAGGNRKHVGVPIITLVGLNRVTVRSTVEANGEYFDNFRLFCRDGDEWLLLSWANEPAEASP